MFDFSHSQSALRDAVTAAYRRDEAEAVADMLVQAQMSTDEKAAAEKLARRLVTQVRAGSCSSESRSSGKTIAMRRFSLSISRTTTSLLAPT